MIAAFARFDIVNFLFPLRRVLPALVLVFAVTASSPWPALGVCGAAIVMSLLAAGPFAADERGRLDTLYSTLPLTRGNVVAGRYLAYVLLYIGTAALASIAAVIVQAAQRDAVDYAAIGLANVAGAFIFALALAVQLPFFFSVGYTRARLMTFIPAAVVAGGAAVVSQLGVDTTQLVSAVVANLTALCSGALIASVVVLIVSIGISTAGYRRRAL